MSGDVGIWTYSFVPWPDETWGFNSSLFDLFERMKTRIEIDVTDRGFEAYRSDLSHHGITMREIERVPWREPETVL